MDFFEFDGWKKEEDRRKLFLCLVEKKSTTSSVLSKDVTAID